MRRRGENEQRFLERIKADTQAANWSIELRPVTRFIDGYAGFCDEADQKIVVAAKHDRRWEILVHEYCHFLQFQDGLWTDPKEAYKWVTFHSWLAGEITSTPKRIMDCVRTIQACELDCEKRVVQLATQYGFETFDRDLYIRQANAYIICLEFARMHRRWYRQRRNMPNPISSKRMLVHLPGKWINDFERIPEEYRRLYEGKCL